LAPGQVWINGASSHFYGFPAAGPRTAGQGREEGLEELLGYCEAKSIHIKLV
jgi:acyl-CoA reductase-like NAD-dependent aldehyde dehydrogenase